MFEQHLSTKSATYMRRNKFKLVNFEARNTFPALAEPPNVCELTGTNNNIENTKTKRHEEEHQKTDKKRGFRKNLIDFRKETKF